MHLGELSSGNKVKMWGDYMGTRYMIISKPAYIRFRCPHCKKYVEILFQDADYNTEYWEDGAFLHMPSM